MKPVLRRASWGLVAAALAWHGAATALDCRSAPRLQAVAPGVWVWPGHNAEVHPANGGHVATATVLVEPRAGEPGHATVIDPGPSLRHGQRLDQAVRCQLNARVVRLVNTHAHAENVLANAAWADPATGTPNVSVLATARTQAQMAERCPDCLDHLTHTAGAAALQGTRIVLPNHRLAPGERVRWTTLPWLVGEERDAHTHSDLTLWQADQRLLVAGGLVYAQRLPELAQGSLAGWVAALDRLAALAPRWVIGQQVSGPQAIATTRAYLCDLAATVWTAMEQGLSASEAETLVLPRYAGWTGYAERQGFNAQRAWRELEPLWMAGGTPPCGSTAPDVVR